MLSILLIIGIVYGHYDDPYKRKCEKDEIAIQITGILGEICSPQCTDDTPPSCPTDVPSGVTATPQCALHSSSGLQYCCLVCDPNSTKTNVCGKDASCKAISNTGICTYDDSPPPPSSKHWEVFPSPTFDAMSVAVSLAFIDASTGWVGGGDNEVGAKIMKTIDGGATWEMVYPSNASQPKLDIFLSAAAMTQKNVVIGGALFQVYSTDGNFFNGSINDYLSPAQDAEIIPDEHKFALISMSPKCNGVATSRLGKIWKCTDIGVNATLYPVRYGSMPTKDTWYVTAGQFPDNSSNTNLRSISQKIRFNKFTGKLDFSRGMRAANPTDDNPPYTALISKTTDGGATWSVVFHNTTDYYFNDIDCFSENHCVAAAEGDSTHIFLTMDGGKTWDEVLYDSDPKSSLMRVAMISEKEVWVTGGHMAELSFQGRFWHSLDGGKTFELEFIKGLYIIDIDMIDPSHGHAIGLTISSGLELVKYKSNATIAASLA